MLGRTACCVVALAAAALALGGCGGAGEEEAGGPRIVGGTEEQRALVREIATRLGPDGAESVRIGPPDELWPIDGGWGAPEWKVGVDVTPAARSERAVWEAWLLAGAFRDISATEGLPAVDVAGMQGDAAHVGPREAARFAGPGAAEALAAKIRLAVVEAGGELLHLDVLVPNGTAAAVTVRTSEPARFLRHELGAVLAAAGDASDGWYVRLVDGSGELVWWWWRAARLERGSGDVADPRLAACSPIPVFPIDATDVPPPCVVG